MQDCLSGVLIAGSSHTGKTTLARRIAETLGWTVVSTDTLARHPGRPWPEVRKPVAEYYSTLTAETIYWFLRVHHENMWPLLLGAIDDAQSAAKPTVFEGSALRPEYVARRMSAGIVGICLHADAEFLQNRMRSESEYSTFGPERKAIIDKFIDRSLRDNAEILEAARTHGLICVDAGDADAIERLYTDLITRTAP
ncbi:hypothetical protein [Tabrizicola sp.]|uniref:hypothetical protein n=1 Tax=Tabrizicola sp. TaxID=2005166 RepID=UPI003F2EECEC